MDHQDNLSTKNHNDFHTFKYIYSCDIVNDGFKVKVCNLDGIFPSTNHSGHFGENPGSKQNSQQNAKSSQPSFSSVQNNYNYNIVEVLEELDLINDLASSDDDHDSQNSSLENPDSEKENSLPSCTELLNNRQQELKSKQKKSQKLAEIIFGGRHKEPVRALSCHPLITCDLISNGQRLCPPQQTQYKQMSKRYEWNEWLLFSLTIETLPRDTRVCFTIWDTIGPGKMAAVARTSISLFSKHGCLRKGIYDLRLYFNDDCFDNNYEKVSNHMKQSSISDTEITNADLDFNHRDHRNKELIVPENEFILNSHNNQNSLLHDPSFKHYNNQRSRKGENKDISSIYFTSTTQYMENDLSLYPNGNCGLVKKVKQLNKLKKKYYNGQIPKVNWLDLLTFLKIENIIVEEKAKSTFVFLTVEFPIVGKEGVEHCVVYFEDHKDHCCQYDIIEKEIVTIQDPEISLENLVEQKHHKLARSARSGISDRDLKPNATIRNQLNVIVSCPSTKQLTNEEQDLVWKFRFYLRNQKKALTKFLKTVNWNSESEAAQAISLIDEWAPMDVEDALELLSPQFRHPYVRKYAVSRIKEANDDDLLLYLLQLVQALKYEDFDEIRACLEIELKENQRPVQVQQSQPHSDPVGPKESRKLFSEGPHSTVENFLSESIKIFSTNPSSEINNRNNEMAPSFSTANYSPTILQTEISRSTASRYGEDLATFLINRASSNDKLANYFYWYLMVESDGTKSISSTASENSSSHNSIVSSAYTTSYLVPSPPIFSDSENQFNRDTLSNTRVNNVIERYTFIKKRFMNRLLHGGPEMVLRHKFLERQQEFVIKLVNIMKDVERETGNRLKKIEKLQNILKSPEAQHKFNFSDNEYLPFPLNPEIKIVGVAWSEASLFKSAMMPAKLPFYTTDKSICYTIFKYGDDLRQDNLVLQIIILMDKLLRMENLDLKLTPYRVLACSSKHGFVQYIDSLSVAEVMSADGSIQNYLRKISLKSATISSAHSSASLDPNVNTKQQENILSTSPGNQATAFPSAGSSSNLASNSISPEIMDAYIKSCAGYCIITYLLGVGDRHLDNLMLTKTGRLFHIDFGFILGRDPKHLRPPPMKITREMVDAMGGMNSENFAKFCTLARTAFLHLRRHANLILNLFSLIVDANMPDIALEPDKTVQKVQDKFKLELNDEQAAHHIIEQVDQSVRSFMPVVVDQLHKMTQYLRN